jgi:hypothetical protein
MNSFLQILLHLPKLVNQLKEVVREKNINIKLVDNIIKLYDDRTNTSYLKNIKFLMGEVNPKYGQYVQNDSQMFGIDLINEMIVSIKDEKFLNDSSNELIMKSEIKEEINLYNFEKFKKILFKEYKEEYNHKEENEICLEKMFQFHEYALKVKTKDNKNINLEKVDFETFLNIPLILSKERTEWNLVDLLKTKYAFLQFPDEKEYITKIDTNISENENLENITNPEQTNNETNNKNNNDRSFSIWEWIIYFFNNYILGIFKCNKNTDNDNNIDNNIIKKNNYIKYRRLASLPKILIISINRAILGKEFNLDQLKYKDYLDMEPFVDKDLLNNNKSTKYKLFAVNECMGHIRQSGHCYSYIKLNNKWTKFNDNNVSNESPDYSSKYVVGLYYIQSEYN